MNPIAIRDAKQRDLGLIYNSWIRSYRHGNPACGRSGKAYFGVQHHIIERLLVRSDVKVACYSGAPDVILGWLCLESGIVHYVYVKNAYRGLGVAKHLLGHLIGEACRYSHRTRKGRAPGGWTYAPETKE